MQVPLINLDASWFWNSLQLVLSFLFSWVRKKITNVKIYKYQILKNKNKSLIFWWVIFKYLYKCSLNLESVLICWVPEIQFTKTLLNPFPFNCCFWVKICFFLIVGVKVHDNIGGCFVKIIPNYLLKWEKNQIN